MSWTRGINYCVFASSSLCVFSRLPSSSSSPCSALCSLKQKTSLTWNLFHSSWTSVTSKEAMWAREREDTQRGAPEDRCPSRGVCLGPDQLPTPPCLSKLWLPRTRHQNKWKGCAQRHTHTARRTLTPRCPPRWGNSLCPRIRRRLEKTQTPDHLLASPRSGLLNGGDKRWRFIHFVEFGKCLKSVSRVQWRVYIYVCICVCEYVGVNDCKTNRHNYTE